MPRVSLTGPDRRSLGYAVLVLAALVAALPGGGVREATQAAVFAVASFGGILVIATGGVPLLSRRACVAGGCLFALIAWYLLGRAWAVLPAGAMTEAGRLAAFAGVLLASAAAGRAQVGRTVVAAGVVAVAAIACAPTTWTTLTEDFPFERAHGWIGYTNATAAMAAVLCGCAVTALLLWGRSPGRRVAVAPVFFVGALTLAAAASRGMLVAAFVTLLWLALSRRDAETAATTAAASFALLATVSLPSDSALGLVLAVLLATAVLFASIGPLSRGLRRLPLHSGRRQAALLAVVTVVALVALLPGIGNAWDEFVSDAPVSAEAGRTRLLSGSGSHRWQWWNESAHAWQQSPVVGKGGDAFAVEHLRQREDLSQVRRPHNLALQLLLEGGVVALLLAGAALSGALSIAWNASSRDRLCAGAAACAVGVVVGSLADWTLSVPLVALTAAAALGVATAAASARVRERFPFRWHAVAALLLLAGIVPFLAVATRHRADETLRDSSVAAAMPWYEISVTLVPSSDAFAGGAAAAVVDGSPRALRRWARAHNRAVRNDAASLRALYDLASSTGETAVAAQAQRRLATIDPKGPPP